MMSSDEIRNALRLAKRKKKPVRFHHTIAREGYEDGGPAQPGDDSSRFVQEQLHSGEPQLPQSDPEGGMRTAKRLALDAYGLTDIGGAQEALGYMPKPEGGYEKSALQHAREGDYLTGGMLAMGAMVPGAGKVGKLLRSESALAKAAQGLGSDTTREMYQSLVNEHKPVRVYESVPTPATTEDLLRALHANKREKVGRGTDIPEGSPVGLRLDIPAYTEHGVW